MMAAQAGQGAGSVNVGLLEDVLKFLRRRVWLIVLCAVLGGGGALGLSLAQTPTYSATANLLFLSSQPGQELFGNTYVAPVLDPQRAAATNEQLVSLPLVRQLTAAALRGRVSAARIGSEISIVGGGEADIVSIVATDPNPQTAALIANTFARQYVEFRRNADRAQFEQAQALVAAQLRHPRSLSSAELSALQQRSEQLQILASLQTGNTELVQEASPPTAPSHPTTRLNVALGILVGLLAGLLAAFLLERFDRRISDADQLAEVYELPLLGLIPKNVHYNHLGDVHLPAGLREPFWMLRVQLRYFNVDRKLKTVLVHLRRSGRRKVDRLVAADTRRRRGRGQCPADRSGSPQSLDRDRTRVGAGARADRLPGGRDRVAVGGDPAGARSDEHPGRMRRRCAHLRTGATQPHRAAGKPSDAGAARRVRGRV